MMPLRRVGALVRHHVYVVPPDPSLRARLVEVATARSSRSMAFRPWVLAPAFAMAACLVLWMGLKRPWTGSEGSALTFRAGIDLARGQLGAYFAPVEERELALHFSDGSQVTLEPAARARVTRAASRGATVVLESGQAIFDVVHAAGTEWNVSAGPYTVFVTGTSFNVSWDAASAALEVGVSVGAVVVRGPGIESGIEVQASQRFVSSSIARLEPSSNIPSREVPTPELVPSGRPGSVAGSAEDTLRDSEHHTDEHGEVSTSARSDRGPKRRGRFSSDPVPHGDGAAVPRSAASVGASGLQSGVSNGQPVESSQIAAAAAATPGDGNHASTDGRASSSPTAEVLPESWPSLVARGEYKRVLAQAELRGFDVSSRVVGAPDLSALADAARFSGRNEDARRALVAVRSRFPGTERAVSASFLLGRLIEDLGRPRAAVEWYDRYLSEAPSGPLAPEALGRRMLAFQKSGDPDNYRRAARDYLQKFPNGTYAGVAREAVKP